MSAKYAVVAQYEHQGYEQNEIIGLHSRYELAEKAANGHSMRAIKEVLEGAKKGDNIRALEINQSASHGGKRPGAGRPLGDPDLVKVPVGYKLPRWLVEWIREQEDPAAQLIERALTKEHELKPPRG